MPIDVSAIGSRLSIAVMLGLVVGKPLGIVLACWLTVKTGLARLPQEINWGAIVGGGFLCGIGFTMALFIAELALGGEQLATVKIGVLVGSVLSAILAMGVLLVFLPRPVDGPDG